MNPSVPEQLNMAERVLRESLHRHDLEPSARPHLERALSHVHEAQIAANEIGKARTVQRLVSDLDKAERLIERVRRRQPPGVVIKPVRI